MPSEWLRTGRLKDVRRWVCFPPPERLIDLGKLRRALARPADGSGRRSDAGVGLLGCRARPGAIGAWGVVEAHVRERARTAQTGESARTRTPHAHERVRARTLTRSRRRGECTYLARELATRQPEGAQLAVEILNLASPQRRMDAPTTLREHTPTLTHGSGGCPSGAPDSWSSRHWGRASLAGCARPPPPAASSRVPMPMHPNATAAEPLACLRGR